MYKQGFMPERSIFMPTLPTTDDHLSNITNNTNVQIPPNFNSSNIQFETVREDLIEGCFRLINCQCKHLGSHPTDICLREEQVRASANQSPMLLHSMHSMGANIASAAMLPPGMTRPMLALSYLEKAATYFSNVINNPCNKAVISNVVGGVGVLSLFLLCFAALRVDRGREALCYFDLAIKMAKDIGLNNETKLMALSPFDYERENLRGIWWAIYIMDRFLYERNLSKIQDDDNNVFLPSLEKIPFDQPSDKLSHYGLQIMANKEWFTPSLPNQSLDAYRLLLFRIFGKALKYNYSINNSSNNDFQALYVSSTLQGSLHEWWRGLPNFILSHLSLAQSESPINDPAFTWRVIYTVIHFNYVKHLVHYPCLLKNVMERTVNITKLHSFVESINIAHDNATVGNYLFHTCIPLVIALRMDLPPQEAKKVAESLEVHIRCLREHTTIYEIVPVLIDTLEYLLTLPDAIQIIREFTRFKSMSGETPSLVKNLPEVPRQNSTDNYHGSSSGTPISDLDGNVQWNQGNAGPSSMDGATMMMDGSNDNGFMWGGNKKGMPLNGTNGNMGLNSQALDPSYIDLLLSSDPFFQTQ
ncbi:hypothetical protein HDV02_004398 [Globomyces sp. JEL0801]|nr:hypothetical protein HDV02_004398 [Globomyces sp. JEL0801]